MTTADPTLVTRVHQVIEAARQEGRPTPGRPTLARLTGATDHAVRKALAELANQATTAGEPEADQPRQPTRSGAGDRGTDGKLAIAGATEHVAGASGAPVSSAKVSSTSQSTQHAAPGGRLVAWTGFVFGSVMSIAANVLHAWLPAAHQPPGWSPGIAPQIGAAVWPIGLMLAVEALSRIQWPKGFTWGLARYGGAGTVALGSAVISYGHLRDLLLAWQYPPPAAAVGPLVLDGLMIVCGFALLAHSRL